MESTTKQQPRSTGGYPRGRSGKLQFARNNTSAAAAVPCGVVASRIRPEQVAWIREAHAGSERKRPRAAGPDSHYSVRRLERDVGISRCTWRRVNTTTMLRRGAGSLEVYVYFDRAGGATQITCPCRCWMARNVGRRQPRQFYLNNRSDNTTQTGWPRRRIPTAEKVAPGHSSAARVIWGTQKSPVSGPAVSRIGGQYFASWPTRRPGITLLTRSPEVGQMVDNNTSVLDGVKPG